MEKTGGPRATTERDRRAIMREASNLSLTESNVHTNLRNV